MSEYPLSEQVKQLEENNADLKQQIYVKATLVEEYRHRSVRHTEQFNFLYELWSDLRDVTRLRDFAPIVRDEVLTLRARLKSVLPNLPLGVGESRHNQTVNIMHGKFGQPLETVTRADFDYVRLQRDKTYDDLKKAEEIVKSLTEQLNQEKTRSNGHADSNMAKHEEVKTLRREVDRLNGVVASDQDRFNRLAEHLRCEVDRSAAYAESIGRLQAEVKFLNFKLQRERR